MNYNTDTTRILAEGEMKEGHFDRALQLFQSIIEHDSNNPEIWFSMAACKLYNLTINPLQHHKGSKATIEVAFQYFAKSISCFSNKVIIFNPNNRDTKDISTYSSKTQNIKIFENNSLSVAFQIIEALRSLVSQESKAANQNFDAAKNYAMQAGATRMMGILNANNNFYNNAFRANFAMQNEAASHNLQQQYKNNLQSIEQVNDIIQNLKDACRYFISNLLGYFSQDELDQFNWQLLSEDEKKAVEKERANKLLAQQRININIMLEQDQNYITSKERAKLLFQNKKYNKALEAANLAYTHFHETARKALGVDFLYYILHREVELKEIIDSSKKKIKSRHKALVWLSVLLCIVVFICLFCI